MASNGDDELVELAEILGIVSIAGDVRLAGRQQMKLRGLEAEPRPREPGAEDREADPGDEGQDRMAATRSDDAAERAADEIHAHGAVGCSLGRRNDRPPRPIAAQ